MSILRLAFELFVIYILYKFIFEFIIPVYNTSKQVKRKMNEMHEQMNQTQHNTVKEQYRDTQSSTAPKKTSHEDYIDYEEIK